MVATYKCRRQYTQAGNFRFAAKGKKKSLFRNLRCPNLSSTPTRAPPSSQNPLCFLFQTKPPPLLQPAHPRRAFLRPRHLATLSFARATSPGLPSPRHLAQATSPAPSFGRATLARAFLRPRLPSPAPSFARAFLRPHPLMLNSLSTFVATGIFPSSMNIMDIISQLQEQVNTIAMLALNTFGTLRRDAPPVRLSPDYPEPPATNPSEETVNVAEQSKAMSAALVQAAKKFDMLVVALPLSGENAQLKRIVN
ncbi:Mediator of RNA polymerase II transcription subunit 21, partial [Ananas comosus]